MTEEQGARLKKLRVKKGFVTAADAARAYGWPLTTYQAHENGSRGLNLSSAARYSKAFGTTSAYLLTGSGNGTVSDTTAVSSAQVVARVSAGAFRLDEGLDEGNLPQVPIVPRRDIPGAAQYAVIIDGPSVNLRIPDGAYAICALFDSYPGGAQHGQLVHVVRERAGMHEHTIKELRYTRDGMILMPCSSDPRYQEEVKLASGDDGELVRIQGVVIGSFVPF